VVLQNIPLSCRSGEVLIGVITADPRANRVVRMVRRVGQKDRRNFKGPNRRDGGSKIKLEAMAYLQATITD
jgi:hypothetical protein